MCIRDRHKAMQEKQYSEVASNAKVLMKLIGLEANTKISFYNKYKLWKFFTKYHKIEK